MVLMGKWISGRENRASRVWWPISRPNANTGFEEDIDRRRPAYRFQRNSYLDARDDFDSPDYQDPDLYRSSDFESQRNRDFGLRNGDFHSSKNGDFNSPRNRDSNSTKYRDSDSSGYRDFHSSRNKDFDSSWNGDFNLSRNRDFDSPRSRDFDSPRSRDFDSLRNRVFDSSMSQDFDLPRSKEFSTPRHFEERSYRGIENNAYSDGNEEFFPTKITPTKLDKQLGGIRRDGEEYERLNPRYYDHMDTGFRRRHHEITQSSDSDGETFNTRIDVDHTQKDLDGKQTLVVRKRKTEDNADRQSETASESSSLKAVARKRTSRTSAFVHTLPSNERRTKNFQNRKLEALGKANNIEEYTGIYRSSLISSSEV